MTLSPEQAREFVAAGAKWLDKHEPGWLPKITIAKIDIKYCDRCIGGQLGGDYYSFKNRHSLDLSTCTSLGFSSSPLATWQYAWCDTLTEAWKALIAERRSQS
jgi:hypothetical protein